MKKLPSTILTGVAFALLLVGCGQQDNQDQRTSDAGSSIIGEDRTSQAPARDPSLPAADTYDEPDGTGTTGAGSTGTDSAGAGSTGMDSAGVGTNETDSEARISSNQDSGPERDQTSPGTLTQEEERNDMPLPGQNSDHSTPDPDQTSSR